MIMLSEDAKQVTYLLDYGLDDDKRMTDQDSGNAKYNHSQIMVSIQKFLKFLQCHIDVK